MCSTKSVVLEYLLSGKDMYLGGRRDARISSVNGEIFHDPNVLLEAIGDLCPMVYLAFTCRRAISVIYPNGTPDRLGKDLA